MVDMYCCVQGYSRLTWMKLDKTDDQWFELDPYLGYGKYYRDKNQTLYLERVQSNSDETHYMCVAYDGKGSSIKNTVNLQING